MATWSLKANLAGNVVHSFTETSIDGSGQTASSTGVTLFSQASKQSLQGGTGNDVLIGGPNDTLTGGLGSDTFVFNRNFGKETIKDFNVNQDVIAFDRTLFSNATPAQVLSQTHDSSGGAVIAVDALDTLTLTGVTVAQLQSHASDFHFFDSSTGQLVQAMAAFGGGGGAADSLNTASIGTVTSQQTFLTTPQHA
jgi:Ca2+-binding RTX toxin-like protein